MYLKIKVLLEWKTDCEWLYFTLKENVLYSFLIMCFVSLNLLQFVDFKYSWSSVINLDPILGSHVNHTWFTESRIGEGKLWPVLESHWMSNRWLNLARTEKNTLYLHWWDIVLPVLIRSFLHWIKITPVLLTKAFLLLIITPVLSAIKIAPSQEGGPLFCAL